MIASELNSLKAELAALPLAALRARLDKARAHDDVVGVTAFTASPSADQRQTAFVAGHELISARNAFESTDAISLRLIAKITVLERIAGAAELVPQIEKSIQKQNEALGELQTQLTLTEASIAKLCTMQQDAAARLSEFSGRIASNLLIDVGMPGTAVKAPGSADVLNTQQEVQALALAIEKAQVSLQDCSKQHSRTQREIQEKQRELLRATADALAFEHSRALGVYLPKLAALRSAQRAAYGNSDDDVDVENMARAMNRAASNR